MFRYYRNYLSSSNNNTDEINWHFHPIAVTGNPLCAATSYVNSYSTLYDLICRRIIEDDWFPVVNRPGFHSESPILIFTMDSVRFANQSHEDATDQPDLANGGSVIGVVHPLHGVATTLLSTITNKRFLPSYDFPMS